MNTIETNTLVAAPAANNTTETTAPAVTTPKAKIGRPRTNLTKEVVFLLLADGSYKRRSKGKPAHDSKAMLYRVPWDYAGYALPESAEFVEVVAVKDTRKPKTETPAESQTLTENPVVPTAAEMLPLVV